MSKNYSQADLKRSSYSHHLHFPHPNVTRFHTLGSHNPTSGLQPLARPQNVFVFPPQVLMCPQLYSTSNTHINTLHPRAHTHTLTPTSLPFFSFKPPHAKTSFYVYPLSKPTYNPRPHVRSYADLVDGYTIPGWG